LAIYGAAMRLSATGQSAGQDVGQWLPVPDRHAGFWQQSLRPISGLGKGGGRFGRWS